MQTLPFPAVTLNAAKLTHRYRLVEAMFDTVKFDCSGSGYDRDCEVCMNETKRVREDLFPFTKVFLDTQISGYARECRYEISQSGNMAESRQRLRERLVLEVCWRGLGSEYVRVTFPCLANRKTYFAQKSKLMDIMARTFRISNCQRVQDRTFKELSGICVDQAVRKTEDPDQGEDYWYNCESDVMALSDDVLCYALANWMTMIPTSQETFNPGVVLKTVYQRTKEPARLALELLDVLINQRTDKYFQYECLWATVSTYGIRQRQIEECEKQGHGWDFWLAHLDLVYRFQKQLIPPTSRVPIEKSETVDADVIKRFLVGQYFYQMRNQTIVNDYATILSCKFGHSPMNKRCDLFSNLFTSNGIGYTFNNEPFWTLFKSTRGNLAFYQEMYAKTEDFENELPRNISQTGHSFSLDFVLRHNSYGYVGDKVFSPSQEVYLTLHDPSKVPNLKSDGISIQPGLFYDIRVVPTVTVTNPSGLALDPKTRNCLSKQESWRLHAFNTYSQSACILECKLRMAISTCKCLVWEYPWVDMPAEFCTSGSSEECFQSIMSNDTKTVECGCLNDCQYITYNVDVHVTKLRRRSHEEDFG